MVIAQQAILIPVIPHILWLSDAMDMSVMQASGVAGSHNGFSPTD
jgi:hypothetical protein